MVRVLIHTVILFGIGVLSFGPLVQAQMFSMPGVIQASGCRVGAVLSTEQFTSTGFSNVRTANPNDEIVAGSWVVANNHTPEISVVLPPNCLGAAVGLADDGLGMNIMGIRMKPTINSAAEADIREIKLVWDVNVNGLWDPLLDLVLQVQPGNLLDTQDGAVFFNGAQSPLAFLAPTTGITPANGGPPRCTVNAPDSADPPFVGVGPNAGGLSTGTNTRAGSYGCFIAFLAIVVIGDNPTTGSQFGLELEGLAGDIPGTTGISSYTFSSGFSSSRNPQASNVRLHMVGGDPSSFTPLEHISNGSGSPESAVRSITFTGGQAGEGLLSRFRAQEIIPGTREAIAMTVGLCDGAELVNRTASILPAIAGAPPTIAGNVNALPCIGSAGTDGFATGINGATLIFRGPLARYMSTVRMYWDECSESGVAANLCEAASGGASPVTLSASGGGDGILFQSGELVEQVVPVYNEQTGEAIAQFGGRQEQILYTGNGVPVAHGSDPCAETAGGCGAGAPGVAVPTAGTTPAIGIWTVDIDSNATGGIVDVILGLQSFDDTAINAASGGGNPCSIFFLTAPTIPAIPGAAPGSCGSNFLNIGPEIHSFSVEAPTSPSTPNNLGAFDTNNSCFLDDPEFFSMIDGWVDTQIGDNLFFNGVDAWVAQTNICAAAASSAVNSLSLDGVDLRNVLGSTNFSVNGQGIDGMSVEIFQLNGKSIFANEVDGRNLTWNQMTTFGAPVANGTYLFVVSVKNTDGQIITSDVQKLLVVR